MRLNDKQMAFCQAILAGKNKRQAAIFAGHPPETASQNANSMWKSRAVQEYLARHQKMREVKAKAREEGRNPEDMGALSQEFDDPMDFLRATMNDTSLGHDSRMKAATALMPYRHGKQKSTVMNPHSAPPGKKEQAKQAAQQAGDSVFGTAETAGMVMQ